MTSTDKNVKQRIYDAATALFARQGYGATGMREIADAAGLNLSRVTYYFSGKLGLLRAVLTDYWERYYDAPPDSRRCEPYGSEFAPVSMGR